MKLEERVAEATNDKKLKNDLIGEYQNFILAAASKVLKRSVTTSDDEYIIAMVAFGDAIDGYNENKGNFLSFAKTVIRNRIIDSIRREAKHNSVPFSALEKENSDGETIEFEIHTVDKSDLMWEIESLTEELSNFEISFFELAEVSPKSRKTKRLCFDAVNYIINNSELVDIIMNKHILPIKEITDNIKLNRKAIERHRKYIITAVIAITQDYPAIAEYFNMREV